MRTLVALLSATVLVTGCGGSSSKKSSTAVKLPGGKTITGSGYSVMVPSAWNDAKASLTGTAIKIDNAYVNPVKQLPKENIVVIRENPPGISNKQLGAVGKVFREQASGLADSHGISAEPATKLDGEPAQSYGYVMREGKGVGRQRQEFAIHKGSVYTITWTAPTKTFAASNQLFDQILASWHWTD